MNSSVDLDDSNLETSTLEAPTEIPAPISSPPEVMPGQQRPHTRKDDSDHDVDGLRQMSIDDICKLASINWGSPFIKMSGSNAAQSLTMVCCISV